ncbi:MAG: hypothetical protein H6706_19530 [Myxococcales bacterium]|nr:hypothetical protein [Myxococcales bacterium]
MADVIRLEDVLGPEGAADILALAASFGAFRPYVSSLPASGLGKGLVRRHDALMNHVGAQTRAGRLDDLGTLAARINPFRGTFALGGEACSPAAARVLHHPRVLAAARAVAGTDAVAPDMIFANLLVPGQELPIHTDTPAFVGLDQANTPEWLLVCMAHSGLFRRWHTPTVGAVFFLGGCVGGDFVYYPDGPDAPAARHPVRHDSAIVLDGERLFHGIARVGGPDAPAPPTGPGMGLEPDADGGFTLRAGDKTLGRWPLGALRFSMQWKAKCAPAEAAPPLARADAEALLTADLRARGVIGATPPDDRQLALRMIETYVPFPTAVAL